MRSLSLASSNEVILQVILHASGRVLSGSVTVVLGGATLVYDIYKLNNEVQEIARLGEEGASELRVIADQLEASLMDLQAKNEEDGTLEKKELPTEDEVEEKEKEPSKEKSQRSESESFWHQSQTT